MKRKLISYDVFERIESDSLSKAQKELTEAQTILASALGVEGVNLHCYSLENALFETTDGTFVHVNYTVKNNALAFDNIEELVLNEEEEVKVGKDTIRKMVDAILENNIEKAGGLFNEYVTLPGTKRILRESVFTKSKKSLTEAKKSCKQCNMMVKKMNRDKCNEWHALAENIGAYLQYQNLAPVLKHTTTQRDERGNVVGLSIPTEKLRNEAKLLQLTYKNMLDTELKVLRGKAKGLAESMAFAKAMADVKRHNAISDNDALQETLENVVSKWPQLLYLTQTELAEQIKTALKSIGASNYDDNTCDFMAEGILRVAHHAYTDRVNKLVNLSGVELCQECDQFEAFQDAITPFFMALDENVKREMDVYVDLYEAFRQIHSLAGQNGNNELRVEAARYLSDLSGVIKGEIQTDVELVREAQEFLAIFVETNLAGHDWKVSNTPRHTVNGDVPEMAEKARQGYAPSKDASGEWGDPAPVSDGKSYHNGLAGEMRANSWGNVSSNETWPSLSNPYIPKPFGDYTMKGETGADKADDATVGFQSKDTWPNLQNPYVPAAVTPQTYQMNGGKEQDLVVDK